MIFRVQPRTAFTIAAFALSQARVMRVMSTGDPTRLDVHLPLRPASQPPPARAPAPSTPPSGRRPLPAFLLDRPWKRVPKLPAVSRARSGAPSLSEVIYCQTANKTR